MTPCFHLGDRRLATVDHAPKIDVHRPAPVFDRYFVEGTADADTGVVRDEIDAAESLLGFIDECEHGVAVGDVAGNDLCATPASPNQACGLLCRVALDIRDHDRGAVTRELDCQGSAQPTAASGDHRPQRLWKGHARERSPEMSTSSRRLPREGQMIDGSRNDECARAKSFWGWGWEDKFPSVRSAQSPGAARAADVGVRARALRRTARPRRDRASAAAHTCTPGHSMRFVTDAHEARVRHTYGRSYRDIIRGFRGDFSPAPDLVATPSGEQEIADVLDWASDAGVAVIPYGGGTSVVGGIEGDVDERYAGVVSLDLERLGHVLEVEPSSMSARIQAGATGPVLEGQLAEHGLTLRHFPQSFEFSTLGGWIATRAGGHFATVYTHIDDLVQSTRAITPRGVWESRRLPGSGAGPSPDRMMLGSEGILGVITEAWMRVRPRPVYRATATVHFAEFEHAVDAVRALSQSGLYPSNCRLLDKREAALNGVTMDGTHVLVVGFESADHRLQPWMNARPRARAADRRRELSQRAPCIESPENAAGRAVREPGARHSSICHIY